VGAVPEGLGKTASGGALYQVAGQRLLLKVPSVGRFLISDGDSIVIEPAHGASLETIHLFLFGSAFGALLHQRACLPLHASAIETSSGAVVFAGPSGVGKSTLAGEFWRRGYRILADEISVICCSVSFLVVPSTPFLLLWADAIQQLEIDATGLHRVRQELQKYLLPLGTGFCDVASPVKTLYILEPSNGSIQTPTPVNGLSRLESVAKVLYNPKLADDLNTVGMRMKQIAGFAGSVHVRKIDRPQGSFSIRELADEIEEDLTR
jgi:hypothetical protein